MPLKTCVAKGGEWNPVMPKPSMVPSSSPSPSSTNDVVAPRGKRRSFSPAERLRIVREAGCEEDRLRSPVPTPLATHYCLRLRQSGEEMDRGSRDRSSNAVKRGSDRCG